MQALPENGFVRISQLASVKSKGVEGILPFSAPTIWRYVSEGTFPEPVKISPRVTAWRVADIRQWYADKGVTV